MCLKESSKRHLGTVVWRFRTLFKRDRISVIYSIMFPCMFIGMSIGFGASLNNLKTSEMTAVTDNIVTASTYEDGANIFQPDASFSTK